MNEKQEHLKTDTSAVPPYPKRRSAEMYKMSLQKCTFLFCNYAHYKQEKNTSVASSNAFFSNNGFVKSGKKSILTTPFVTLSILLTPVCHKAIYGTQQSR